MTRNLKKGRRIGRTPKTRRAGDFSASRDRVQAVDHSEAADQWPQPQWSRVNSCDGRKTIEQPNEQMEHA
jgi:hypothetical protein